MRTTAGMNASSELKATCWASPIPSWARKDLIVRRSPAHHSRAESRAGESGGRPTGGCSVAVDNDEPPETGLRRTFAAPPEDEPHRRTDAAGEQEARAERDARGNRQVAAEVRADVGCLLDLRAQGLDRVRQLVALVLDLPLDVPGCPVVGRHQLFSTSVVCLASAIA